MLFHSVLGAGGTLGGGISEITSITTASYEVGSDDQITLPSAIQEGDLLIAVCATGASQSGFSAPNITERYLDGFTGISFDTDSFTTSVTYQAVTYYTTSSQAKTIQYKIATANDANSNVSGFIYTSTSVYQGVVLYVVRANAPITTVEAYSLETFGGSTGNPVQRTISTALITPISLAIYAVIGRNSLPSVTNSPAINYTATSSPDAHGFIRSGVWVSTSNNTYTFDASDSGIYTGMVYGSIDIS